jgi:hypothetical protein
MISPIQLTKISLCHSTITSSHPINYILRHIARFRPYIAMRNSPHLGTLHAPHNRLIPVCTSSFPYPTAIISSTKVSRSIPTHPYPRNCLSHPPGPLKAGIRQGRDIWHSARSFGLCPSPRRPRVGSRERRREAHLFRLQMHGPDGRLHGGGRSPPRASDLPEIPAPGLDVANAFAPQPRTAPRGMTSKHGSSVCNGAGAGSFLEQNDGKVMSKSHYHEWMG